MKQTVLALFAAAVMLMPFSATAHDAKLHKGKQTKGEIVSVSQGRVELKTGKGNVSVLLSEKPKIEIGGAEASASALTKGQQVAVIGTTLGSGEIVAKEILVERSSPKSGAAAAQSGHSAHQH